MKEKISLLGILVNSLLAAGKITVGVFAHSASILADGFHSLADIFSSFIGYFGIKKAQQPADAEHPYGHFKFEVLSGIVIVLFLLAAGIEAIFEAYQNYLDPQKINLSYWTFVVMLTSVAVNFATSQLKIYYGKKESSLTLLTDGMHDKADVLASGAVLLGLLLSRYWIYADALLACLIGLYIIKEAFPIGKEAIDSLLDVSAGKEVEDKIKNLVQKQQIDLASLKTQKKGSAITANLEINLDSSLTVEKANQISDTLRKKLMQEIENLQFVIIQIKSHALENNFYQPTFGRGFGWQRKGRFKDELPQAEGKGPDGQCVCPQCGYTTPHQKGVPCSTLQCPVCHIHLERK
jgi:cation diffusion facilitator family transporter